MTTALSVGTHVYGCASRPETHDAAGFAALTFTEIGEVTNIGEFGGQSQIANHMPLRSGATVKRKGSSDYGSMSLQIGRVRDDGQDLLKSGFDGATSRVVHSFKITTLNDYTVYLTGVVASFVTSYQDSMAVTALNCNIEIDNSIVVVDADGAEYLLAWGAWRFEDGELELL